MNATCRHLTASRSVLAAGLILSGSGSSVPGQIPAIPEPPVLVHGTVTDGASGLPVVPGSVVWQVSSGGESGEFSAASVPPVRVVPAGGAAHYLLELPFETRVARIDGASVALTRQGQALDARAAGAVHQLRAFVNGRAAVLRAVNGAPASGSSVSLANDPTGHGKRLQVDLTLPDLSSYEGWAAANFPDPGAAEAAHGADADRDGATNEAEWQAGTDPRNPGDRLTIIGATTLADGRMRVTAATVPGKRYQLRVSADLASFAAEGAAFTATGTTSEVMVSAGGARRFLRLDVVPE